MNPKISIIMPVYGVEDWVGRAIESILAQTFTDFEFFAVDDGTPDKSGEICDSYAAKDSRIKVLHKENGGAPSARNMAIPLARGKYLYFMDSDDWVEPTMLEDLYNIAETCKLEVIVSGFYIDTFYSDNDCLSQEISYPSRIYESQQEFRENAYHLFDRNLLYTPWNKLYLTEYIHKNKLLFPNTFWDDFPFNLSVFRDVERVGVTYEQYYHFIRARAESETAKYRSNMYEKREEEHAWMLDIYNHWGVDDKNSMEMIQRRYLERIVGCIENVASKACALSRKEKIATIKDMICNPKVSQACKIAKPRSLLMKTVLIPVRLKMATFCYWEGCFISSVKSSHIKTFASLKMRR